MTSPKIARYDGPEPMTRANLDVLGGGDVISIVPVCHTGAPVFVVYESDGGALALVCAVCRKLVTKIKVADTGPHSNGELH
jgi:hypothetical protein